MLELNYFSIIKEKPNFLDSSDIASTSLISTFYSIAMSKYLESQRQRAITLRDPFFNDPGQGLFLGKLREFVLKDSVLNLFPPIREAALAYFKDNQIPWWKDKVNRPTGHLLSSQIACVNHLFSLRDRQDIATEVLRGIEPTIKTALSIDDGFVAFEFIGKKQYLKERGFTRGANCTSIDAAMLGETKDNKRILFLIEWKYTESYERQSKYIPERAKVYDHLIEAHDSPFVPGIKSETLYYEPFYQMMRQTLLAHQFELHRELDCGQCLHIHVIPDANKELKTTMTSPAIHGKTIHDAWAPLLKEPHKYRPIDPATLLKPASSLPDTTPWLEYLATRYW